MATDQPTAEPEPIIMRLRKGGDLYVFIYDAETRYDLMDRLERYASDERLNFNFDDLYLLREIIIGCGAIKEVGP